MNVWVTGSSGQMGQTLLRVLKEKGIDCFGSSHREVDIADPEKALPLLKKATHIINCAGYTQVDPAETEREKAAHANALGPEILGRLAFAEGKRLIHISTDYVFDGLLGKPYREDDHTHPVNWYGKTKRDGEIRTLRAHPEACVVRVSWIFGGGAQRNYAESMLERIQKEKELRFVSDQMSCPTYAIDFAAALIALLDKTGLYHYCNKGSASKYTFASTLLQMAKERNFPVVCEKITPILSSEFPAAAKRPLNTSLDTGKIETFLKIRPWQEGLKDFLARKSHAH